MAEPDPMVQVEAAIVARLTANNLTGIPTDPQLAPLLPGGVHSRSADGDTFPYLSIVLVRMDTDYTFSRPYRHRFRYDLPATDQGPSIDQASAILERVYDLLQDVTPAEFPMEDFTIGFLRRIGRVGTTPNQDGVPIQRLIDQYAIEVYPNG